MDPWRNCVCFLPSLGQLVGVSKDQVESLCSCYVAQRLMNHTRNQL